jgi:hypothetical protein
MELFWLPVSLLSGFSYDFPENAPEDLSFQGANQNAENQTTQIIILNQ